MILVVDDDPDVRESLSECLASSGHQVSTAENGQRALDQLGHGLMPDLILLDLRMPLVDGYQVLERLREEPLRDVPVLLVTALRDVDARALERSCGLLPKPIRMDRLLSAVDRAVSGETANV